MRVIRILVVAVLALGMSACACRAKKVGGPDDNIPVVSADGVLKDVYFSFDKYDLSADARNVLTANSEWLKANDKFRVQIEGHCDERGTNEYNMVLGANRAKAVYDFLRSAGVATSRMSTVSYGEELPLDPRHSDEAWSKNRRAHFNVQ